MKKIDIIIPMYNAKEYIINCLDSIKNQTIDNFNVIVIDDGSTDSCVKLCNKYIKENNITNIKVYSKENGGPSSARNYGIKCSKSEYLCFIDSDDTIEKNHLEKLMDYNSDISICGYKAISKMGETINYCSEKCEVLESKNIDKFVLENVTNHIINPPFNKLYKNSIIKENNILFDEKLKMGEDLKFNLEYLLYCKKIVLKDNNTYLYNEVNINSLTSNFNENRWNVEKELYNCYVNYFNHKNCYKDNKKIINEFLLVSLNKTLYTLLKSNKEKKYVDNYIKMMINDPILKNKKFKISKKINYVTLFCIKTKLNKLLKILYSIKIKRERKK